MPMPMPVAVPHMVPVYVPMPVMTSRSAGLRPASYETSGDGKGRTYYKTFNDKLSNLFIALHNYYMWKARQCPCCGNIPKITEHAPTNGDDVEIQILPTWGFQTGTLQKIGYLMEIFVKTLRCYRKKTADCLLAFSPELAKEMIRTLEVDEKSVVHWKQWFRDVFHDYHSAEITQIERPSTLVLIDETHIECRKGSVGRTVCRDWLEGIRYGTRLVFVKFTDHCSSANLDAVIQRQGLVWERYNNLPNGVETVNHSAIFMDSITGMCVQRIVNNWSHAVAKITLVSQAVVQQNYEVLWMLPGGVGRGHVYEYHRPGHHEYSNSYATSQSWGSPLSNSFASSDSISNGYSKSYSVKFMEFRIKITL
ncbi:hypothetical protein ANCDUO_01702 [Ancylostoma duodenale]|uniref:Uncharacterized protein n=1 Tax=Ancylostoma duodenale TaxID=51022 RepID=A0A0C2H8L8_9BILA|nr:hypothetical protein ANCDUO_01702 [Ancylostoma duodenale]